MNLPLRLTFYSADYALDGGSTTLYATGLGFRLDSFAWVLL